MPFYSIKYKENDMSAHREWNLAEHKDEASALALFNENDAIMNNLGRFGFDKTGSQPQNSDYIFYEFEIENCFKRQTMSQFIYNIDKE